MNCNPSGDLTARPPPRGRHPDKFHTNRSPEVFILFAVGHARVTTQGL